MKYRQIISGVLLLTPVCIALKILHMLRMIDGNTGFVKNNYANKSGILLFALAFFVIVSIAFGATVRRSPIKMPESKLLALGSIILGVALTAEFVFEKYPARVPQWQVALVMVLGAAAAVVFLAYGFLLLFKVKFPPLLLVVPAVYGMAKLLLLFTESSSVALIIDNAVSVLAQGAVMVFLLMLAKQANGVVTKRSNKLLMCSGIAAIQLCLVGSVPALLMRFLKPSFAQHESVVASLVTLALGLFAFVFIIEFYSNKNLSERTRRKSCASHSSASNHDGISYFSTLPEENDAPQPDFEEQEAVPPPQEDIAEALNEKTEEEPEKASNPFKRSLFKDENEDAAEDDDNPEFSRVILE